MVRHQENDDDSIEHFEDAQPQPQQQTDGEFSEDLDHQESSVSEALVIAIVPFVLEVPLRCEVNTSNNFSTLDSEDNVPEMQDELVREVGFVSGRWGDLVETAPVQLPVKRDGAQIGYHKNSSIWPGIRKALNEVYSRSQWVVGLGHRIDFWRDRWAGTHSIQEALHLSDRELRGCSSRVSSIIGNGHKSCLPAILELIQNVGLSINNMKRAEDDTLIWLPDLKAANAWKLHMHIGRAATDLAAKEKGIQLASKCKLWTARRRPEPSLVAMHFCRKDLELASGKVQIHSRL
ncbi:hypothetical protein IFM89_031502 [Coptis chinensis]|uniref:Uncharacterized protein n=1 Tax=Coptis chinensis TaxID=261450 RepID=A0A835HIA3_9MAGN|nr:hypothetical protein IFM89_031502 [Coptis chinensis]